MSDCRYERRRHRDGELAGTESWQCKAEASAAAGKKARHRVTASTGLRNENLGTLSPGHARPQARQEARYTINPRDPKLHIGHRNRRRAVAGAQAAVRMTDGSPLLPPARRAHFPNGPTESARYAAARILISESDPPAPGPIPSWKHPQFIMLPPRPPRQHQRQHPRRRPRRRRRRIHQRRLRHPHHPPRHRRRPEMPFPSHHPPRRRRRGETPFSYGPLHLLRGSGRFSGWGVNRWPKSKSGGEAPH